VVKQLILKLIVLYRKYLSPHKGFRCAYGVLHGGNSCSTEIYKIIDKNGFLVGFPLARLQLKKCGAAYRVLSSAKVSSEKGSSEKDKGSRKNKKPKKKKDKDSCCDLPCYGGGGGGGKGGGVDADCDVPCDCSF